MSKQFVAVVCPSLVMGGKELPLIVTIKFTHHPGRAEHSTLNHRQQGSAL